MRACRWAKACTSPQHGLIGDWHAVSVRMLTYSPSIRLRSRQLPYLSPRLTDPRPPRLVVSSGHARGASLLLHWLKYYLLSSAAAPRRRTTGARDGSFFSHTTRMTCGLGPPCHRLGLSSAAAPRRCTTGACSGLLYRRARRFTSSAPKVQRTIRMTCRPEPPCHRLGCLGAHRARFFAAIEGRRRVSLTRTLVSLKKELTPRVAITFLHSLPIACAPFPLCSSALRSRGRTRHGFAWPP
jgi:hypothetical protein